MYTIDKPEIIFLCFLTRYKEKVNRALEEFEVMLEQKRHQV